MEEIKKGVIKVNPFTYKPVLFVENGRVLWGGTKREQKGFDVYEIDKKSIDNAFDNLMSETVGFTLKENKFGETVAIIETSKKKIKYERKIIKRFTNLP